jgi:hypothetical protein
MLLVLLWSLTGIVVGMVYLLKIKRINRWTPVAVIAGIVLVTRVLPYVELFSDLAIFLLLLAVVIAGIHRLLEIEWIKRLTLVWIATGIVFVIVGFPGIIITLLWLGDNTSGLLDRFFPVVGKFEIIELDKFKTFSGKEDDRYYFTVLVKGAPKNTDKLKARMVQYFYEKARYINSIDSGSYLGSVNFLKYGRRTAYFINNDEDHKGWGAHYLYQEPDVYYMYYIGTISTQNPCESDSTKYENVMYLYNKEKGKYKETADGLYSECGGTLTASPADVRSKSARF